MKKTLQSKNQTILIIGANSSIAKGSAEYFAELGYDLYLVGRDLEEINRIASDLELRNQISVNTAAFDSTNYAQHAKLVKQVIAETRNLFGALLAVGMLGNQKQAEQDFFVAEDVIATNYLGPVSILTHLANYFSQQKQGFLAVLSSVAADRGRQSNYVYGSSKAALDVFLEGLRQRLHANNTHVLCVKPGFVDTKMTYGLSGMFLLAKPDKVGKRIAKAALKGRPSTLYVPWFWRYIMLIIKSIPGFIFNKLNL